MRELKPWKIIRDEIMFSLPPYIRVRSHTIELPGGKIIEPYLRIEVRPYAVMCVITPDGDVLVARQYRHGIGRVSLLLPGGIIEAGEDPLAAAKRELREETGFSADDWESLGRYAIDCNYRAGEAHLFLARGARKVTAPDNDDLEETEWLLLPFSKLLDELRAGNVVSLSSATAIGLAHARLGS